MTKQELLTKISRVCQDYESSKTTGLEREIIGCTVQFENGEDKGGNFLWDIYEFGGDCFEQSGAVNITLEFGKDRVPNAT
jgi:hypothetical protein